MFGRKWTLIFWFQAVLFIGVVEVNSEYVVNKYQPLDMELIQNQFMSPTEEDLNYSTEAEGEDIDARSSANEDPETAPQLFEGDIAIDQYFYITLRLGVNVNRHPNRLWPNATIPFKISERYNNRERQLIINALKTINALTCVKFTPYKGILPDYIYIAPPANGRPGGCWSYVGRKGGRQIVSLQGRDGTSPHCFSSEGRILHELLHAIGIYHEQSRSDRDKYIKIHWDNIMPKFRSNFKLISTKKGKHSFAYDYNSVMHYGEFYFSKKKGEKPTLTPLQRGIHIGQRRTLSKTDCMKINDLYDCLKGRHALMYKSFCNLLGYSPEVFTS